MEPKEVAMIGIFAAVTAVLSQVSMPLPVTPVPISCGLVAVYTSGILMKPRHALYAQMCYVLIGAVGIPVYAGFRGGVGALVGPTGGFLMAYPVIAGVVSIGVKNHLDLNLGRVDGKAGVLRDAMRAGVSMCIASAMLYLSGAAWLGIVSRIPLREALSLAVFPFLLLDAVKIVFCIVAIVPFRTRLQRAMYS
jgi:biotin transport system substrate-specific component